MARVEKVEGSVREDDALALVSCPRGGADGFRSRNDF
jgi:hypothetical protein